MASSASQLASSDPSFAAFASKLHDAVVVHPLVLLSAVDHHYRIQKDLTRRRVVGVLLGEVYKGRIDVTNSFAVPFEEDSKDPNIFFVDHDYLERCGFLRARAT